MSNNVRIFQFHSGSAVGDAVTNAMFYIKDILHDWQIESEILVQHRDCRLEKLVGLIGTFCPRPDDLLIIHHSMGHDIMPLIESFKCIKILIYHNITPPRFFQDGEALKAYSILGLQQLQTLKQIVVGTIAISELNAAELLCRGYDQPAVIPLLRDFSDLRSCRFNQSIQYVESPRYQLIFVGRICANKGQIHLVRFMELYSDSFEYPVHLTLVGHSGDGEAYADELLKDIARAGLEDRISVVGHVSNEDLYGYYRLADAYVSYSEHEGFGVPLIEAMAFDIPVVALDCSAIGGTLGSAGIKLKTTTSDELAGALHKLFSDSAYRMDILKNQRKRLLDFDRVFVGGQLIDFLRPFWSSRISAVQPRAELSTDRSDREPNALTVKRQYIIEGPCETNYSLAIVNRNLGVALSNLPGSQVLLVPMEGQPGYTFNKLGLRRYPEIGQLLEPLPNHPDATIVSVRNMYPFRPAGMKGDYRIANLAWEESELSFSMARLINRYIDGMAAPTEFVKRVYRNSGIRLPTVVYGHGVDHLKSVQSHATRSAEPFIFLNISSGLARKGIEELFLAFVSAFKRADKVLLIIKTTASENNIVSFWYDRLIKNRINSPSVQIIYEDLDVDEMTRLYDEADVVILPTKGEGFNFPAAEALARGVPLMVTGYSGQMDFCSSDNAHLIDYDFELSGSHLGNSQAMWARPRVPELAAKLRQIFTCYSDDSTRKKMERGREMASSMTWTSTAAKFGSLLDALEQPRLRKKLRVGWVSTWNTRCGIATYSQFLVSHLPPDWFDITIFCNHWERLKADDGNVISNWTDRNGNLDQLLIDIVDKDIDVVVFQYNYGFYSLEVLADAVLKLNKLGKDIYIFFHKTEAISIDEKVESIEAYAQAFSRATRLVVHSLDDVNRLKQYCLVDNVVKIPHGSIRPQNFDACSVRRFLGLAEYSSVIGCYGFLLPPKGILELILAFNIILGKNPKALLLLVNSLHLAPDSLHELNSCKSLVKSLGISDNVIIVTDFLEDEESSLLLQACDVIALPYRFSGESASGAVRYALSSGRPVVTTPLAIFDDVKNVVYQAKGFTAFEIASAIQEVLENSNLVDYMNKASLQWLDLHDWSKIAERFANMVVGLYEDNNDIKLELGSIYPKPAVLPHPEILDDITWLHSIKETAFVQMIYQRFLGRNPEQPAIDHLVSQLLNKKETRVDIFERISSSDESKLYISKLSEGRYSGKQLFVEESYTQIITYDELDVGDDEAFVRNLYVRLFNRESDEAGWSQYVIALGGGMSRKAVVNEFLNSEEFLVLNRPIQVINL